MGRPKGSKQGSVFYDNRNKNWKAQYYVIDNDTKKEKRLKKSFKTEKEAHDFLSNLLYQKSNDLFIANNGIPLNQLMKANLQKKFDMNLISETQYGRVLKTIDVLEKNPLMKKKIEDITSDEIQDFLNTFTNYSNSYIKKLYEQLSQAYKYAMNKGYISRNPLVDVVKPKSSKQDKVVRALEVEEQQKFTDYLMNRTIEEEPYKNIFLIQMYMGLRVGEACALRSTDINLAKKLLYVNKTLTTDKDGYVIMGNTTKTYAGVREIPIPEFIKGSLIEQMRIAENNKDKQLFLSKYGNYIDNRNVNYILKKRLKELDIEGISTHSLRHTYGTRCVEAGMRAVALQRLMGHNDVSVTLNTYTSVFNKYKESELEKVNDYYINSEIIKQNEKLLENNLIMIDSKQKGEFENEK